MTSATRDEQITEGDFCRSLEAAGSLDASGRCGLQIQKRVAGDGRWRSRALRMVLWCLLLFQSAGCGLSSFTNGGIPEGKSVVKGRVIAADNPLVAIANVPVTVYSTPTGESTVAYRVLTDAQGQFVVTDVITGKRPDNHPPTVSNVLVSVNTDKTPYQPQKVLLMLTEKRPATVILAVPPSTFDLKQVGSVHVTSPVNNAGAVGVGDLFPFTAQLFDHNNNPIVSAVTGQVYVPSLVLDDLAIVTIGQNGYFEASGSAVGLTSIIASISLPNSAQFINSPALDVPVAVTQTVVNSGTPQIAPGIPTPPAPPRSASGK